VNELPTIVEGTLTGAQLEEAVEVSVRAFSDDPFFGFLFPNEASRDKSVAILHRVVLRQVARIGVTRTALVDGHVVGVAIWIPPGRWPYSPMLQLRQLVGSLRAFLPVFGTIMRSRGLFQEIVKAHPKAPHWYLQLLMVDPSHQRQGIGGALQTPTLDVCDAAGLPAWLETQKEDNLAYYGRFGFTVISEHRVPDGPAIWSLNRDPKG
jgi:GNAT superfamily N-acetyltransferase